MKKKSVLAAFAACCAGMLMFSGCGNPDPSQPESNGSQGGAMTQDEIQSKIFDDESKPTMRTVDIEEFGVNGDTGLVRVKVKDSYHIPRGDMSFPSQVKTNAHNEVPGYKVIADDPLKGQSIVIRPAGLAGLKSGDCGFEDAMAEAKKIVIGSLYPNIDAQKPAHEEYTNISASIRTVMPDTPLEGANYDPSNSKEPIVVNLNYNYAAEQGNTGLDSRLFNVGDHQMLAQGIVFPNGEYAGYGSDVLSSTKNGSLHNLNQPIVEEAKEFAPTGYNLKANGYYQSKSLWMADTYEYRKRFLDAGWKLNPFDVGNGPTSFEGLPSEQIEKYENSKNKPSPYNAFPVQLGAYKSCSFPAKATLPKPLNKWTEPDPISGETVDERVIQLPRQVPAAWFGQVNV